MFHLPPDPADHGSAADQKRWTFIGKPERLALNVSSGDDTAFALWSKPAGCNFVKIMCIGGGGGGGGGGVAATPSSATNPGGGGASGAITHGIWPAFMIPDQLYVKAGYGGQGGYKPPSRTATSVGDAGGRSFVSIIPFVYPETSVSGTQVLISAPGGAGSSLGASTAGSTGAGGTVGTNLQNIIGTSGVLRYWPSTGGSYQGSASTTVADKNAGTDGTNYSIVSGGAGGGQINNSAGLAVPYDGGKDYSYEYEIISTALGGTASTITINATNGQNGRFVYKPYMLGVGGGGGGASVMGYGGNGGNGGIGCGGGGAGAGQYSGIQYGGNGGPGLVIIEVF